MDEQDGDPYLYPGTVVLKNRFDIFDPSALEQLERRLTRARADQGLPKGRLDYAHYKAIHHHLFQDVYDWAGELRTVDLAKGDSFFCRYGFIDAEMAKLFTALRDENYLVGLDFNGAARRAAHYIVELNAIHPFREGNGRTQHAFLALLLEHAGHPRDFSKIDPTQLLDAAIAGFHGIAEPMERVILSLPPRPP